MTNELSITASDDGTGVSRTRHRRQYRRPLRPMGPPSQLDRTDGDYQEGVTCHSGATESPSKGWKGSTWGIPVHWPRLRQHRSTGKAPRKIPCFFLQSRRYDGREVVMKITRISLLSIGLLCVAPIPSWSQELKFTTQDFPPFSYNINGVVSGPAVDIIRPTRSMMPEP